NHDVWAAEVTAGGGIVKRITNNRAADMQPAFSPDGKLLAVRAQRRAGFEADRWYLDLYDRAGGAKRTLFESPDLSVEDFRFSPDGAAIWFTAEDHGATNLYVVPTAGGAPKPVTSGGSIAAFAPGGGFAVVAKAT